MSGSDHIWVVTDIKVLVRLDTFGLRSGSSPTRIVNIRFRSRLDSRIKIRFKGQDQGQVEIKLRSGSDQDHIPLKDRLRSSQYQLHVKNRFRPISNETGQPEPD